MSFTLKCYQQYVVDLGDDQKVIGSRNTPDEITLDNELIHERHITVPDDYGVVNFWSSTAPGVGQWSVCIIDSDQDILVRFVEDLGGAESYTVMEVRGGVPQAFFNDSIAHVDITDEAETTMDVIERICLQRNVADGTGDAKVRAILLD